MTRSSADVGSWAWALADGRSVVPEPRVKALLAEVGVHVPRGVATEFGSTVVDASDLTGPVALKAFGPGVLHKTDLGAVQLGLDPEEVPAAIHRMRAHLATVGITDPGFLVEEQAPPGTEIIVGVVDRPEAGLVVLLGHGGTLAEAIGHSVLRLWPIATADAHHMLRELSGWDRLRRPRRGAALDEDALISVVIAIAGPDGLVARLEGRVSEVECNPVIVRSDGAVAVDARLITADPAAAAKPSPAVTDFGPLFHPRSVGVIGASSTKVSFGNRFLDAYTRRGWREGLYAIHPEATEIDGVPAVPSIGRVPAPLDYLVVAVPAATCAEVVRSAAGRARFAQVMTGGFREAGPDGAALEADLLAAAHDSGIRVIGPNCMGIYCPAGRQTWQLGDPTESGHVSVLSQSGGLAGDVIKAGAARGLRFSKVASVGNAADVGLAELVAYLETDPDTMVIGLYLEGLKDHGALVDVLRTAQGTKPAVALVGALGRLGAMAAASHTGGMAGDAAVWQAVTTASGLGVVRTLEHFLGALALHQRYLGSGIAEDGAALLVGPGGGASVLGADACDRFGVDLRPVEPSVRDALRAKGYGAGNSVANPVEIGVGPAAPASVFDGVVEPILAGRSYADVVCHVNVQSFYSFGGAQGPHRLLELLDHLGSRPWGARVSVVLRNLDCATPDDTGAIRIAARNAGLPHFTTFDEAFGAIRAVKEHAEHRPFFRSGSQASASTSAP